MLLFGPSSRRVQRRVMSWLVLPCVLIGARAQPTDVAGTLPEDYLPPLKAILQNAWTQSPRTVEKSLELAQQEAGTYIYNSERLPHLRGTANFASTETAVSGNNASRTRDNGLFYTLELTQSLFRWGELKNKTALGQLSVLMAEKNYAEAYRSLTNILRQSYMELVARKIRLNAARYNYELATGELKLARENLQKGLISPGDLAGRELDWNEHAVELAGQEEDFGASLRLFARLSGAKDFTEKSIPDEFPRPTYTPALAKTILASLLREGGKFTFEAEMNALQAQQADLNYRIARVKLLPKFDIWGSYSLQNLTTAGVASLAQTGVSYQTVAVRMDWWIFDGFAARGEKRQALLSRELFEKRTAQAVEAALETAQQLERRLALDARKLEFGDTRFGIAVAGERQQQTEFELGKTSQAGISAARANRLQSEANNATVRANFLARWSEFVSLAGLDPMVNHLPARYAPEKR